MGAGHAFDRGSTSLPGHFPTAAFAPSWKRCCTAVSFIALSRAASRSDSLSGLRSFRAPMAPLTATTGASTKVPPDR